MYSMINEETLIKFGFVKEDNDLFLRQIKNKDELKEMHIKEIHIDTYSEDPFAPSSYFTLLLRASEKNAIILISKDRIIFKRNDKYKTHFVNVPISKIIECYSKTEKDYSEFILNIQNIYYKITILN